MKKHLLLGVLALGMMFSVIDSYENILDGNSTVQIDKKDYKIPPNG